MTEVKRDLSADLVAETVKRDLHHDLTICNAATPGPWESTNLGDVHITKDYRYENGRHTALWIADMCEDDRGEDEIYADACFIAEARAGWPEAIRRAMAAEETLAWIIGAYDRGDLRQTRMSSGTDAVIQRARDILQNR